MSSKYPNGLIAVLLIAIVVHSQQSVEAAAAAAAEVSLTDHPLVPIPNRTFGIDYENNRFLMNGTEFRYVSGSIHYFRVPPEYWEDRLTKIRAAGLNAIETYVEWASHEPEPGQYDFEGMNDFVGFLKAAQAADLYVILRVGPYICAERDFGGLPYWLLSKEPQTQMKIRSKDANYLTTVDRWFSVMLPKVRPLLYRFGGPVLAVQIENEFGSYTTCDFEYMVHLRDEVRKYLGRETVLFTVDGPGDGFLKCGKVNEVYTTVDFGTNWDPAAAFAAGRIHQSSGPLVNSEFYPGWLDHWAEPHATVATADIVKTLDGILTLNASVNLYMIHGGTNFGFMNGANWGLSSLDTELYQADPTSYDYDAPLTECGDPTDKYQAIADVIKKHMGGPDETFRAMTCSKMSLPPVRMQMAASLFKVINGSASTSGSETAIRSVKSKYPMTFEQLRHGFGYILYETTVGVMPSDPAVLTMSGLADRALVYVDTIYQGTASRMEKLFSLPIKATKGSTIQILVENQGRIGYGAQMARDTKGLNKNVTLGPITLTEWTQHLVPTSVDGLSDIGSGLSTSGGSLPAYFVGKFTLNETASDTFLRLDNGWGKGHAILNGRILGRYWPETGPQVTLYAPAPFFKGPGEENRLELFEMESSPLSSSSSSSDGDCAAHFVNTPILNGTVPYMDHKMTAKAAKLARNRHEKINKYHQ